MLLAAAENSRFAFDASKDNAAMFVMGAIVLVTWLAFRKMIQLSKRKSAQYVATRSGGCGDVIVLGGAVREGITEDYLTVQISGTSAPRGARLPMVLRQQASGRLVASPSYPASE